jgi:hypothetical protein
MQIDLIHRTRGNDLVTLIWRSTSPNDEKIGKIGPVNSLNFHPCQYRQHEAKRIRGCHLHRLVTWVSYCFSFVHCRRQARGSAHSITWWRSFLTCRQPISLSNIELGVIIIPSALHSWRRSRIVISALRSAASATSNGACTARNTSRASNAGGSEAIGRRRLSTSMNDVPRPGCLASHSQASVGVRIRGSWRMRGDTRTSSCAWGRPSWRQQAFMAHVACGNSRAGCRADGGLWSRSECRRCCASWPRGWGRRALLRPSAASVVLLVRLVAQGGASRARHRRRWRSRWWCLSIPFWFFPPRWSTCRSDASSRRITKLYMHGQSHNFFLAGVHDDNIRLYGKGVHQNKTPIRDLFSFIHQKWTSIGLDWRCPF